MNTESVWADDIFSRARQGLERWTAFAERYWWPAPDRPDLSCFGSGYNGWGVQTNQKYLGACAVLLTEPQGQPGQGTLARAVLRDRVLQALRFSLESHVTGSYHCTDGARWGLTSISQLGVERMMHGVDAANALLTDADRAGLRRVFLAEADHLLACDIQAGIYTNNCPESNIWKGAFLARAARMFPDELHAGDWEEKAHRYFINGIAIRADARDATLKAGKTVAERHVGANFLDHYALTHHGYLNVGYMVICLSNIAMLHYGLMARGHKPPATLYHHAADLWTLVRRLIFNDGRLCRIGGDSRQRYCYCQDYLVPTLLFAADHLGDARAAALVAPALDLILSEQAKNGDGGFLARRLAHMAARNIHYYCRLESDKAVVLSMALEWNRRRPFRLAEDPQEASLAGGWAEPEYGAVFHRSPTRIASWSWMSCFKESPQGLCLPPDDGHLAEWEMNLAGAVIPAAESSGAGKREERLVRHEQWSFEGGFLTCGELIDGANVHIGEGWKAPETARHGIVFAVLPDAHTAVRLELARIPPRRVFLAGLEGVRLNVPNDLFNDFQRRYFVETGAWTSQAALGEDRIFDFKTPWINVEDRIGLIGIYGSAAWSVCCQGRRTGGYLGSLLCDMVCYPLRRGFWDVQGPAVVLDTGCVIIASADAARTRESWKSGGFCRCPCDIAEARAVRVSGWDGRHYLLAANFAPAPQTITVRDVAAISATDLVDGTTIKVRDGGLELDLPPGTPRLLALG